MLCLVNAEAETFMYVAFGCRMALVFVHSFLLTHANITLAHIWCPESAKNAFELTFPNGCRNSLLFESKLLKGTITRPYAHAGLAAGDA